PDMGCRRCGRSRTAPGRRHQRVNRFSRSGGVYVLAADSDKIRRQGRLVAEAHEFVHVEATIRLVFGPVVLPALVMARPPSLGPECDKVLRPSCPMPAEARPSYLHLYPSRTCAMKRHLRSLFAASCCLVTAPAVLADSAASAAPGGFGDLSVWGGPISFVTKS